MVGTCFGVLENLGHHEAYLDLHVVLAMISDALNIKLGFGQTAIFPWQAYVPLRLRSLASGCHLPVRGLENENKEANHPHTATQWKL